jgi:hypothetical protein
MLPIPHPVARAPSGGPIRFASIVRVGPPPRLKRDWDSVIRTWGDAFAHVDARLQIIFARETASSPALEWCLACLTDVRTALYELHVGILCEQMPLTADGPAIVSYLSEAYVWFGDVLDDVEVLVEHLRGGPEQRDASLVEDSSDYIDEFLVPLFDEVIHGSPLATLPDPRRRLPLHFLAERLHVAIVSLHWALMAP